MTSPTRTCIGCRTARPSSEMVRVAAAPRPTIGVRGKGGRGAWLCPAAGCIESAARSSAFSRAYRRRVDDSDFAATLHRWLAEQGES